jgi:hypothetical protein
VSAEKRSSDGSATRVPVLTVLNSHPAPRLRTELALHRGYPRVHLVGVQVQMKARRDASTRSMRSNEAGEGQREY